MTRGTLIVSLVLVAAVFVGSALVYAKLPDRVPIHYNFRGVADGFGSRAAGAFVFPAMMLGFVGLFAVVPWASPRSFRVDDFRSTYGTIAVITLAMLAAIHALMLRAALGYPTDMTRFTPVAVLLGLGLMGNFFGRIHRNFFVGFRLPWTLASERVWNETHRLAAWITTACGLTGALVAVIGYPSLAWGLVVPMIAVPTVFSLVRYKQLEARGEV